MKFVLLVGALALAPVPAEAKGCIKGALVGGVAGHMVHHGIVGALGGCVVGHHIANEKPKPAPTGAAEAAPHPPSGDAATHSPPSNPPLPSPTQP